jgi:ferredoxin--NADP+ reductase
MSAASTIGAGYDLVVVGGNASGLSVAVDAQRAGLARVRVLEETSSVAFPDLIGQHQLDVGYGERVDSIELAGDHVVVTTNKQAYEARACLVAQRADIDTKEWTPPFNTVLTDRVVVDQLPASVVDSDLLVVGHTEHAVELASKAAAAGAAVVLAAGGINPTKLSPAASSALRRLEKERRATVLYRSVPEQITDDGASGGVPGSPLALFGDRRTPDLEIDHVVFASGRRALEPADVGLSGDAAASGKVWFVGEPSGETVVPMAPAWRVAHDLATVFPELDVDAPPKFSVRGRGFASVVEELREELYNAEITYFESTHSDLWVLRVRPDHGEISHHPGQYASLGLGYWEDRIDDAEDPGLDKRWEKLIRRSYSISNRIFDEHGYLAGERGATELEFYIVLVPPTEGNIPGLTPRLALKRPGDRIYLGPKVAGRYTLNPVTDPMGTVLMFSTGTGEAPHNNMAVELLRKGHRGPIVAAVSVRNWADLGYLDKHRELEARYANYHYLPMPTRESDVPKRYIQDLIVQDTLSHEFGVTLDPANTHVFLCGNPAMIGLPEEADGETKYPQPTGVVELLTERGFTLDHRKQRGNLHFEEYW